MIEQNSSTELKNFEGLSQMLDKNLYKKSDVISKRYNISLRTLTEDMLSYFGIRLSLPKSSEGQEWFFFKSLVSLYHKAIFQAKDQTSLKKKVSLKSIFKKYL